MKLRKYRLPVVLALLAIASGVGAINLPAEQRGLWVAVAFAFEAAFWLSVFRAWVGARGDA